MRIGERHWLHRELLDLGMRKRGATVVIRECCMEEGKLKQAKGVYKSSWDTDDPLVLITMLLLHLGREKRKEKCNSIIKKKKKHGSIEHLIWLYIPCRCGQLWARSCVPLSDKQNQLAYITWETTETYLSIYLYTQSTGVAYKLQILKGLSIGLHLL